MIPSSFQFTIFWCCLVFIINTLTNISLCLPPSLSVSGLADIMKRLLTKYDNLFEISFPYSMGWHGKLKFG